jgi:hypothetical protein
MIKERHGFYLNLIQRSVIDPKYAAGTPIDASHGAVEACRWTAEKIPVGLYHIKCPNCSASTIANIGGRSTSITLRCSYSSDPPPPPLPLPAQAQPLLGKEVGPGQTPLPSPVGATAPLVK